MIAIYNFNLTFGILSKASSEGGMALHAFVGEI
jgi:hypothetical protein